MQPSGRCPRCGYVLTYNGYAYYCRFCGYPQTQGKLTTEIRSLERRTRARVQQILRELMTKTKTQRDVIYYPVNIIMHSPCRNCGVSFPIGTQICPTCGTPRSTIPQSTQPQVTPPEPPSLDARVLDYIVSHEGTISISRAAQDLSINQTVLRSSIERLKEGGFLNQS